MRYKSSVIMVNCYRCVCEWWYVHDEDHCKLQLNLEFESDNFIVLSVDEISVL